MTGDTRLPATLAGGLVLRRSHPDDAVRLAAAYTRNRAHLAAWEPVRADRFFTAAGQREVLEAQSETSKLHTVLTAGDRVVAAATLSGIIRNAFQSAHLGYWMDRDHQGRGLMTAVVARILAWARDDLRLHRVEAATLLHNIGSQRVLEANGFTVIGVAPHYLQIGGSWQDHRLYQRLLTP